MWKEGHGRQEGATDQRLYGDTRVHSAGQKEAQGEERPRAGPNIAGLSIQFAEIDLDDSPFLGLGNVCAREP